MEIILDQARRRWSEDEKRALVAETVVEGQTVNSFARRHTISRSMLFGWHKQYREALNFGSSASTPIGSTPVVIAGREQASHQRQPHRLRPRRSLSWSLGGVRLHISGAVHPDLAAAVMKAGAAAGVRVWIWTGHTDMRRGMNGLALQVQQALQRDPHAGDLFAFRGRRGNLIKILWHDGLGRSCGPIAPL